MNTDVLEKLSNYQQPSVWVAPNGTPSFDDLRQLTGLLIVPLIKAEFENHRVYSAQVYILSPIQSHPENYVSAKISFLIGDKESSELSSLRNWQYEGSQSRQKWMSIEEFQRAYCPLVISLGNRRSYMEVFERLSPDIGQQLLLLANDIAALNEFRPTSRLLQEVRKSRHDLWSQFFREDEERFSLIAFSRLLSRDRSGTRSLADVAAISARVPLWGGRFELPLRLSFPSVLGQRQLQNVIIGPNGSGKTNLLLGLAKCVVKGQATITEHNGLNQTGLWAPPISVAIFTYESSLWKHLRNRNIEVYQQGVQANNWRQLTQIVYDFGSQEKGHIDLRLLVEILSRFIDVNNMSFRLYPKEAGQPLWRQDRSDVEISLVELSESSGRVLDDAISRLDRREAPFMRSREGSIYHLSSGERSLAIFCAKLMKAAGKSALVLIDEPENHLHPRFITLMIQTLSRLLLATESRALLVTHSPFVVREFERSTVKVLKLTNNGIPELFRPAMQTLGGDVSMISDHVFEDDEIEKGFELSIDRVLRTRSLDNDKSDLKAWVEKMAEGLGEDAISYLLASSDALRKGEPNA